MGNRVAVQVVRSVLGGVPVIRVTGELDRSSEERLRTLLEETFHVQNPRRSLLFDVGDCEFLDGGALEVLLSALDRLPVDGWLGIIAPCPNVRRLLGVVGIRENSRLHLFASRKNAHAFIKRHPARVVLAPVPSAKAEVLG